MIHYTYPTRRQLQSLAGWIVIFKPLHYQGVSQFHSSLRPFGTKVHNFVTLLVKVFLTVMLQYAQFDCYSQPIITRQSLALFPRIFHPLVASRGIYRLQYPVNSEITGVQNEPYTFILWVALLLRIGEWQA
jgi:hypothetical protein